AMDRDGARGARPLVARAGWSWSGMISGREFSLSASSRLPGREARAGPSDARLTLVVIDQADAVAGRLWPAWGRGPVVRREWVAISSAACWGSTSQGACPLDTS